MKFTLRLPIDLVEPVGEFQTPDAARDIAMAVEQAGFDAAFLTEHPAPTAEWLAVGHDALDPMVALAFVAAATTRLKVHTNLVVLPYRNPFLLAKAATTMQVLTGGRLILGVGVGYLRGEFEALGVDPARRGALADDALATLREIWTGRPVTRRGSTFNAVNIQPRPTPAFAPPIWIGGGSDRAVTRAAEYGDGWTPYLAAPNTASHRNEAAVASMDELRIKIAQIHEARAKAGRGGTFDIALAPLHRLAANTREQADLYIESLSALTEAGVTWAMVSLGHESRAQFIENVQWFGEEVIGRGA